LCGPSIVGKLVLCLDNDDAGVAAIERLCCGQRPILLATEESTHVEVYVAGLPTSVKDPAEYVEANREIEGLDSKFRNEVLQKAVEWTEWYTGRLLLCYNASAVDGEGGSFSQTFESLALFLSVFEDSNKRTEKASVMAEMLASLWSSDGDNNDFRETCAQLESDLLHKASTISRSHSLRRQRIFEIREKSLLSNENRAAEAVPRNLEISQYVSKIEDSNEQKLLKGVEGTLSIRERDMPRTWSNRRIHMNWQKRPPKAMTPHVAGMLPTSLDDAWLRGSSQKGSGNRNHLQYEISVEGSRIGQFKKFIGPETSVRFNHNNYHGTWSSTEASLAGYSSTTSPRNLDFLERGTSSLIEVNKDDVSTAAEDMLLRLLLRFVDARRSLNKSLRVSLASRCVSDKIHWSQPDKEWLFHCLVENADEIPSSMAGSDRLGAVRSYLICRSDCFPRSFGHMKVEEDVDEEDVDRAHPNPQEKQANDGATIEEPRASNNLAGHDSNESLRDAAMTKANYVLSIGDDWSDFAQMDEFNPDSGLTESPVHAVLAITDEYLDSVPVINVDEEVEKGKVITQEKLEDGTAMETCEVLSADVVATYHYRSSEGNPPSEGSLDYLFRDDNNNLDLFSESDFDQVPVKRGDHSSKAAWAAQDLHTILHSASVLRRIQAGRSYLLEKQSDTAARSFDLEGSGGSKEMEVTIFQSKESKLRVMNETELAEYCSPRCADGGLRHDLHMARTLLKSTQRARKRIHNLISAGFSDQTITSRGYSWLNHVLRFNEIKISQWSDIVESKVGFKASDESLEELEEIVRSDWNELSKVDEMWDWNKNVNLDHSSHIAQMLKGVENPESKEDLLERIEDEWSWAVGEINDDVDHDDDFVEDKNKREEDTFDAEDEEAFDVAYSEPL
jgi:hypothetical protein